MPDAQHGRRHFLKTMGATSAVATTAAIAGENRCAGAVQIQTGRGQSSSINSGQPERKERTMSGGGLSKARLDRMHNVLAGHVDARWRSWSGHTDQPAG